MSRQRRKRPCRVFGEITETVFDIVCGIAETIFDIALDIFFD